MFDSFDVLLVVLCVQFWAIAYLFFKLKFSVPTLADSKQPQPPQLRSREEDAELEHKKYIASTEELIKEVPNSTVTRRTRSNYEYYIVYKVPADCNIPLGIYKCTWDKFQLLFPNQRWLGSGVQIKGAKTFNDAVAYWGQNVFAGSFY